MRRDGYADFFSIQLEAIWIDTGFGTRNQFAKGKSVCQGGGLCFQSSLCKPRVLASLPSQGVIWSQSEQDVKLCSRNHAILVVCLFFWLFCSLGACLYVRFFTATFSKFTVRGQNNQPAPLLPPPFPSQPQEQNGAGSDSNLWNHIIKTINNISQ